MIDLKDLREQPEKYATGAANKWVQLDWDRFWQLDEQLKATKLQVEDLLAQRNELSKQIDLKRLAWEDFGSLIEQVKTFKGDIESWERLLQQLQDEHTAFCLQIPSPAFPEVPVGKSDAENKVLEYCGTKPSFSFTPLTHWELLEKKWYLDQDRAVKLSGSRFQIMRGPLAQLSMSLAMWALNKLAAKWFQVTLVPQLVRADALVTTGFLPNDATNIYRVNPKCAIEQTEREEDDLWLIGTAEVALISQHMDETLDIEELPLRYVGYSSCYRREAGTYGKDTKGLIRLHQFEKVEMVSFVRPQDSAKEHEYIRQLEEEIFTELGIPYQRIDICTGDLGAPAAKKYDLEAWFPGLDKYVEVTSTSNTTDFQTRRGNIKYKWFEEKWFVHSLNGTAVAIGRAVAAIVENYQTAEWDILIPAVLQPLMWVEKI